MLCHGLINNTLESRLKNCTAKSCLIQSMERNIQEIVRQQDDTGKHLIFGYVRRAQLLFDIKRNLLWIIPELITYLIIAYYTQIEYFKHMETNSFDMADNDRTITRIDDKIEDDFRTVYGLQIIPFDSKGVHHWKLKIIKGEYIAIGIDEASYRWKVGAFFLQHSTKSYAYAARTGSKYFPVRPHNSDFSDPYTKGDTVSMVLNMNDKTLSFATNDGELKKADDITHTDFGYSLAVFVRISGDTIKLLSYDWRNE